LDQLGHTLSGNAKDGGRVLLRYTRLEQAAGSFTDLLRSGPELSIGTSRCRLRMANPIDCAIWQQGVTVTSAPASPVTASTSPSAQL
jgi:hypothetical protein